MGHEGKAVMTGISALIGETPESPFSPSLPSSQPLQSLTFTSATLGIQVGAGPSAGRGGAPDTSHIPSWPFLFITSFPALCTTPLPKS